MGRSAQCQSEVRCARVHPGETSLWSSVCVLHARLGGKSEFGQGSEYRALRSEANSLGQLLTKDIVEPLRTASSTNRT